MLSTTTDSYSTKDHSFIPLELLLLFVVALIVVVVLFLTIHIVSAWQAGGESLNIEAAADNSRASLIDTHIGWQASVVFSQRTRACVRKVALCSTRNHQKEKKY